MRQALHVGTRTIMLDEGRIVFDVRDPARRGLTIEDLVAKFRQARGQDLTDDRMLAE
jgi:putative ABC transport system ATP-binding protein